MGSVEMNDGTVLRFTEAGEGPNLVLVPGDDVALAEILAANTANQSKAGGRRVQGFSNEVWNQHRENIVLQASIAKFGSDASLRTYLIETGDSVLVEASPTRHELA